MGFCEILEGCSSFRTRKKSCNSTLEILNFRYTSGLGYCIKGIAGRKATGEFEKKKKDFVQGRNWTGGVGVATSFWCRDLAEVRTEGSLVAT